MQARLSARRREVLETGAVTQDPVPRDKALEVVFNKHIRLESCLGISLLLDLFPALFRREIFFCILDGHCSLTLSPCLPPPRDKFERWGNRAHPLLGQWAQVLPALEEARTVCNHTGMRLPLGAVHIPCAFLRPSGFSHDLIPHFLSLSLSSAPLARESSPYPPLSRSISYLKYVWTDRRTPNRSDPLYVCVCAGVYVPGPVPYTISCARRRCHDSETDVSLSPQSRSARLALANFESKS